MGPQEETDGDGGEPGGQGHSGKPARLQNGESFRGSGRPRVQGHGRGQALVSAWVQSVLSSVRDSEEVAASQQLQRSCHKGFCYPRLR